MTHVLPPEDLLVVRRYLYELCHAGPDVRALHATAMGLVRREMFAAIADPPGAAAARHAAQLSAEGVVDLGALLSPEQCAEMRDYFRSRPVYDGHVPRHSDGVLRSIEETRRHSHYGSYDRADVVRCPHVVEIANDPTILQIAEAYLGCPPTIYNLHAWWSFPQGGTPAQYSQALHRDEDELRFLTLFIYLTPVDEKTGPHRYLRFTHDKPKLIQAMTERGWSESDLQVALGALFHGHGYDMSQNGDALVGSLDMPWTGPAGSAIMADTYGLHMGVPLREGERLMLWIRYGLGMLPQPEFGDGPGTYAPTLRQRIPATDRARYVNRLLLTE